jgi:hypothetical protein
MKKSILRISSLILFFAGIITNVCGQTGNTFSNPIVAGTFSSAFNYSNSQNTANFTNAYTDGRQLTTFITNLR